LKAAPRILLPCLLAVVLAAPAHATFHLMQIEQVTAGVNGDITAQAVQLRMRALGENLVSNGQLIARDAGGLNPVVLVDPTTDVANGNAGDHVLICTSSFLNYLPPGVTPDFIMAPIPASYLNAGSLTWQVNGPVTSTIYWRFSWGGASYTGAGTMSSLNDPNANANPPYATALPYQTLQAVKFQGLATAQSNTNLADYALTPGAATWTNNAGVSGATQPLSGCSVPAGIDLFMTPPGGATFEDFSSNPIPAGFFGPNSDPFTGSIVFQGQPIAPLTALGLTDVIVQRKAMATLANPGDQAVVPIEILALSLVGSTPITVTYNGGQNPEQWSVSMCLSSAGAQPAGTMNIKASACACGEGGTFTSTLPVLPKLVFVRTLPSPGAATLDFASAARAPLSLGVTRGHWYPNDPGGMGLVSVPPGIAVDHDCNSGTATRVLPALANLRVGVRADRCDSASCGPITLLRKRMTHEVAPDAAFGLVPAALSSPDGDADGIGDDADDCVALADPLQVDSDDDGVGDVCDNCALVKNACQEDANLNGIGDICDVAGVGDLPWLRSGVSLSAPAPNPSSGTMRFSVSVAAETRVRVAVYSVSGRLVRTIVSGVLPAGTRSLEWDARDEAGQRVTSGAYYLRLDADGRQQARKLMVIH
jgi:hypothetical protein